ncbi:AarF/UbiB family protein [Streptomyces sp. NPDC026206]|uniref:ABC1 kinase family protein n=1 Tax=Streptomyces sp. NPDC026206 TaxID=3157089 RepID=UPI0033D9BF0C
MTGQAASSLDAIPLASLTLLTAVVTIGLMMAAVSVASRRLLGIRVGPLRTFAAGLMGLTCMLVFKDAIQDEASRNALSTVQIAVGLFGTMATLVLAEAALPHGGWLRPVQVLRSLSGRIARARRYSQVSRIFMRHGLGRYLRGRAGSEGALQPDEAGLRSARALRLALEECGGALIKLGQVLSTRRDLMPPHFIEELSRLQSDVPPAAWPEVEAVLYKELGRPVDEVFEWIEHKPVAAASIAQVHRARLRGGPTVAVKVQRPGIRESVERDLDIVLAITRGLQARARSGHALGLRELGNGFSASVHEELDFRIEARNSASVAAACKGHEADAPVRVPRVHTELSSARVLVQEWLEGVTLDRAGPVADAQGLDRVKVARTAFDSILHQIMRVGIFHADPHPGNMLLLSDGRIGLLDFGSVGRIGPPVRAAIQQLLMAVERGDPAGMHDALLDLLGTRATGLDEPLPDSLLLERELGRFMTHHLGPGSQPDTEMFTALFRMLTRFGLAVPPEVAAVFRSLATIEGTLTHLAPDFNLLEEARAFAGDMLTDRLRRVTPIPGGTPGAAGREGPDVPSLTRTMAQEALSLVPMLRRLPRRAERISTALEEGRLSVRVRLLADERERRFLSGLIHQILVTLLAACTGLMGVLLAVFGTGRGPHVTASLELFPLIGYHMLAVSAILTLRVLYAAMGRPPT